MRLGNLFRPLTHIKPLGLSPHNARLLPPDVPVEEERLRHYAPEAFYPVKLGQILHNTYEIVTKVGYGAGSTVWLARDLRRYA